MAIIWWQFHNLWVTKIRLIITNLKFHPNSPGKGALLCMNIFWYNEPFNGSGTNSLYHQQILKICYSTSSSFYQILFKSYPNMFSLVKSLEQCSVPVGGMAVIITVMSQWVRWRLRSPASRLFAHTFVQTHVKENIKAPRHWPLWWDSTGDRWFPLTVSEAVNVSIWWRHHVKSTSVTISTGTVTICK